MTDAIKIDLKKTGFPVAIGSVELWFDASLENLRKFFNIEELSKEKLKEVEVAAAKIEMPENVMDIEVETVDNAMKLEEELMKLQYDIIFGDGSFAKIYKTYPDIIALKGALEAAGDLIAKKIEAMEYDRQKVVQESKNKYLNKKEAKRKE